jgi:tetratricopeptide (TPR) repeat protein
MMDDGSPLSFPATIERVCHGTPHAEGYTDGQGYFAVTLGQNSDVIGDASEVQSTSSQNTPPFPGIATPTPGSSTTAGTGTGRNPGTEDRLSNCELRAQLAGYTSQSLNLAGRTPLDSPDVGTILLHRMGGSPADTMVTATTLKAPKEARRALQKGLDLKKKNQPEEAIDSLRKAVKVDPDFALAWCELGKLQVENGHIADGHESFEAAVKAEPRWPEPYTHLAVMGVKAHDWREVADTTDQVLRLDSFQYPQAIFFNAAANYNLRHIDLAEKSALLAERVDVQHQYPQIEQLLGTIYTDRHLYAEAAEKFRAYLMLAPDAEGAADARRQLAAVEKLADEASRVAQKDPRQ